MPNYCISISYIYISRKENNLRFMEDLNLNLSLQTPTGLCMYPTRLFGVSSKDMEQECWLC